MPLTFPVSTGVGLAHAHRHVRAGSPGVEAESASRPTQQPPAAGTPANSEVGRAPPAAAPGRRRGRRTEAPPPASGPLDVVVFGAGGVAQQAYFPALLALQQSNALNVRAIIESREFAREAATHFFPKAVVVGSVEAVNTPPDALAILTTPGRFHSSQTGSAFKRGWHVLSSTPFAPTAREGALMLAAAQRGERLLAVDLRARFYPAARYLRALCRDFLLGPPLSFQVHLGRPTRPQPAGPVQEKFDQPDGALAELGVHTLDLLTWCLGSASIVSYADDAMGGVEANAAIELAFSEGVRGSVHLSHDWPTDDSYTFVFERGIVRWNANRANGLTLQIASAPGALEGELVTPLTAGSLHPSARLLATADHAAVAHLENIIATIAGRDTLRAPATEAMHSLPLIEECYARRQPLLQPWLTQNEAVQARVLCPPAPLRKS